MRTTKNLSSPEVFVVPFLRKIMINPIILTKVFVQMKQNSKSRGFNRKVASDPPRLLFNLEKPFRSRNSGNKQVTSSFNKQRNVNWYHGHETREHPNMRAEE